MMVHSPKHFVSHHFLQLEGPATPAHGWEPMFVTDGVTATRRPVPGASPDLAVVRGECAIAVPAKHVFEVVRDLTRKGEWDKMFASGVDIEHCGPFSLVGYEEFKGIWPVSGRSFLTLKVNSRFCG